MNDMMRKGRSRGPQGIVHGSAKLDNAKVQEIQQKAKQGYTQTNLAETYGVSISAISRVLAGDTWKHLR
jgi:hypothetical protein